ncbi:unnamed protein product [Anisakis simplex]|uniref:ACB domain-containing protein n=1 Tax=Anisakis simplex TaxID=6269 RepID=A0A158PNN8_ANISI|nr:unnamed protein product [Anisakis simplex]
MNFDEAVEKWKSLEDKFDESEKIELYALHQQATEGDAGDECDSGDEMKFLAWKSKTGMSKEDAHAGFIKAVEEAATKHAE